MKFYARVIKNEPIDKMQHRMLRRGSPLLLLAGGIVMPQRTAEQGAEGRLPSMAPLANPYVPFQLENPPMYDAKKGIVRGTLFPGLDLPFMGMINQKELPVTPLTELQAMAFAVNELALYLDTHRDDTEALEMYRNYQRMLAEGKKKYEREYGPLSHMSEGGNRYCWLNDPWPWEYTAHREG